MPKPKPIPLQAAEMIHDERYRQQTQEGYTIAHDDEHTGGELALLAAAYALASQLGHLKDITVGYQAIATFLEIQDWPFKPKDPISDLVRAGALILAELERRLRAENFVSVTTKEDLDREGA